MELRPISNFLFELHCSHRTLFDKEDGEKLSHEYRVKVESGTKSITRIHISYFKSLDEISHSLSSIPAGKVTIATLHDVVLDDMRSKRQMNHFYN